MNTGTRFVLLSTIRRSGTREMDRCVSKRLAKLFFRGWCNAGMIFGAALLGWHALASAAEPASGAMEDPRVLTEEAVSFENGEGVPKDLAHAADLYCSASRLGYADAQYGLGWMYANGRGVERNDAAASALFALAAKQGHAQAQHMLRIVGATGGSLPDCMHNDLEDAFLNSPERRKVVEIVSRLAPEYKVNPRLVLAIITAESNFNFKAVSSKNAQGLMQLIPDTAARFNVSNPFDPVQNVRGGLAYLRWLLAYFQGNVTLAVAGYNAGEKAVDRYRGIPPYQETRSYVKRVMQLFRMERHPYDETITEPSPELIGIRLAVKG